MTMATSAGPFDRWFGEHAQDVHGLSLEDVCQLPEHILDFGTASV